MSASRFVLAFVFVLSFALSLGACRRDRCVPVCEQRQKELGCQPMESCKATCDKLHAPSPCAAELRGWQDCIVTLPTQQWHCDEGDGQPVPLPGACPDARSKVEACLAKVPNPSPPPKN